MADKVALVRLRALNDAFDKAFDKSREKVEGLKKSIGDTEGVGSKLQKVGADFEATFGTSMSKAGDKLTKGVTLPLAAVATGAVYAAVSWESAWAGVLKTVDGTSEQLNQLEQDLRDMAKELPASHGEIAAVAEAAGQLGIAVEDVAGFTRVMIDLGETTNLSAQDAATALARFSNIMGTSSADVDRLGSTIVELGNNSATTEREIVEMATRLAAAGKIAGLSESDVFAFASALTSVGVEAEAGGTALSKVFTSIRDAVIDGGEKLETFARVSGRSAKDFANAFRSDPAQAITMFVEGMGRLSSSGQSTTKVFEELQLTDQRLMRAILSTGEAQGLLADQIGMARGAWTENNALSDEAAKRYETTAAQLRMLRNQVVDLGIDIGEKLLPVLSTGMNVVGALVEAFDRLPDSVQYGVIAFGALLAAIGPVLKAGGFLIDNFQQIATAIRNVTASATTAHGAIVGIGLAAATAVAGVAAFNAAMKEVDQVTNYLDETVDSLARSMADVGDVAAGTKQWIETQITAGTDLGRTFEATGRSVDELAAAMLDGNDAVFKLIMSSKGASDANIASTNVLLSLGTAVERASGKYQDLAPSTAAAGAGASSSAAQFSQAEQALWAVAAAADEARLAHAGLFQSMFGARVVTASIDKAFADFNKSMNGTGSSGRRAAEAVDLVAKKAEKLEDAVRSSVSATRAWEDANDRLTDSIKEIEDAERALTEALEGPSARDRETAEWDLIDARLSAEDAAEAVRDAEKDLVDARNSGDPNKVRRAENDLEQARQRLNRANRNVTDAETRLNEIKNWSAETDQKVKDAQDRVTDAKRANQRATEDLAMRYKDMTDAAAEVQRIEGAHPSTFANSSAAVGGHAGVVRDAAGAYLDLASAIDRTIASILNADIANTDKISQVDAIIEAIKVAPGLTAAQREELLRFAYAKKAAIPGSYGKIATVKQKMATGGAGTAYGPTEFLAGEAGEPEDYLFAPHSKGGIPGVLDRMIAGTPSGGFAAAGPMYVTVQMPPGSNGQDVVRALTRWERRNGGRWRQPVGGR